MAFAAVSDAISRAVVEITASSWLGLSLLLGVATACYWWWTGSTTTLKTLVNLKAQTRKWPDGSRTVASEEGSKLSAYNFPEAKTLYECIRYGMRVSNNGPMLGYRERQKDGTMPYVWISFQDVITRSEHLANGFLQIGIEAGQNSFITIYSKNRPEWVICEHATYNNRSVLVPLYDTLGQEARTFIMQQTGATIVVCDVEAKATALLACAESCPSLKHIVVIEPFSEKLKALAKQHSVSVYSFAELEAIGRNVSVQPPAKAPKPQDLCTICYTSGTTGMPKGAMLTHENVIASTTVYKFMVNIVTRAGKDVMISYLPMAHMYERMVQATVLQQGAAIGFFRGDIRALMDDIHELRPTIFPLVPRVLNRLYDTVMAEVNKSAFSKWLFDMAMQSKMQDFERGIIRKNTVWDLLVFKRLRDRLGGRIRLMMTGSAPLAEDVMMFARAAMGCIVIEGYGQTECAAACSTSMESDFSAGHVGVPFPCSAIKLVDVPELGYFAKEEVGEVCIRGKNVFQGYFKNEEQTKEALDDEGWLHSGDIGRWNPNGTLSIIDRKKNIFKLQQGEYIAPDKIENAYAHSEVVLQSFIYGESLKTCLIGIVVPDEQGLRKLVNGKLELNGAPFEELCRNEQVKRLVLAELQETGKKAGLYSFEQVKDIYITTDKFTMENELLTPTLKNKRPQLKKYFASELQRMYSQLK